MCGLVAVITKNRNGFNKEHQEVMDLLLFMDTLRGEDSTGIFLVENNGNVKIAKGAVAGPDFVRSEEYQKLRQDAWIRGWAMVGHNRKATRGEINDKNAHPFWVEDKLVLVHNGSYYGNHKHLKDVEVDSEAIAHHIAEADDLEKALQKVNAAYAMIWYDVQNKTLNILRNNDRPLCVVETPSAYILASEKAFLDFVITKCNLKVKEAPYLLKDHNLVKIKMTKSGDPELENVPLDCKYKAPIVTTDRSSSTYDLDYWRQQANHHRACGYMEDCEETPFRQKEETKEEKTESSERQYFTREQGLTGPRYMASEKLIEALGPNVHQTRWGVYQRLANNYPNGKKIRVVINDLVEADENPKTHNFYLLGTTLDDNKVYVTFPITETDFQKITSMASDAVFDVEVDGTTWKRLDVKGSTDIQDWEGVFALHTKNPVPVISDLHGGIMNVH